MTKTNTVDAEPTKQFFVKMLTRDIEPLDAILDLLDNCVDGIIRSLWHKKKEGREGAKVQRPYAGYRAYITANEKIFKFEDNCGGISRLIAEKVAFRLGRPTDQELETLGVNLGKQGTVGLYGIGMKRAIFKMGQSATITSECGQEAFQVEIDPEWLESGDWKLPIRDVKTTGAGGTIIEVRELYPAIAQKFSGNTTFLEDLHRSIAQLFAVIIGKGFEVKLNGSVIDPVVLALLVAEGTGGINPYVFRGTVRGIAVEVVVGFHRDPSKPAALVDEDEYGDRNAAVMKAGWSVICNDRLVLYGDKSDQTGWGARPIPYFHPQYNAIAGVVTMRSEDPSLLPLNTTKHGIDLNFGVYLKVLDYMKDGVKRFIDFTNRWKGRLQETTSLFRNARPVVASEVAKTIPQDAYTPVGRSRLADEDASAEEHKPDLPTPPRETTTRRITFTKPVDEIQEVAEAILDSKEAPPSGVGEECFNRALASIRKSRKRI